MQVTALNNNYWQYQWLHYKVPLLTDGRIIVDAHTKHTSDIDVKI